MGKTRPEFLRVASGSSVRKHLVVIQGRDRADGQAHVGEGFTTTKKIGGAVVRNRHGAVCVLSRVNFCRSLVVPDMIMCSSHVPEQRVRHGNVCLTMSKQR